MRKRPHLPNAPITEAVLDIQVQLPASIRLGQLEAMHRDRDIRDRYPNRRTRKRVEVNVKLEGEVPIATPAPTEDGYLFLSRDGKRMVQARLDGFSFNQLKPYGTWETLRDEAKEHVLSKWFLGTKCRFDAEA